MLCISSCGTHLFFLLLQFPYNKACSCTAFNYCSISQSLFSLPGQLALIRPCNKSSGSAGTLKLIYSLFVNPHTVETPNLIMHLTFICYIHSHTVIFLTAMLFYFSLPWAGWFAFVCLLVWRIWYKHSNIFILLMKWKDKAEVWDLGLRHLNLDKGYVSSHLEG